MLAFLLKLVLKCLVYLNICMSDYLFKYFDMK